MTPKQTERLKKKIADIRQILAHEKRKFGGYDDSRGLRYLPTRLFIQLRDFKGGLIYLKWFQKNFPDDIGFPDFLFEWTLILFKNGKIKDAENKAFQTFCANTYLFDKFFGRQIIPIDKYEYSNIDRPEFAEYLNYSSEQTELADFSEWLKQFIAAEEFVNKSTNFIDISKRIKKEDDYEIRSHLLEQLWQIKDFR